MMFNYLKEFFKEAVENRNDGFAIFWAIVVFIIIMAIANMSLFFWGDQIKEAIDASIVWANNIAQNKY